MYNKIVVDVDVRVDKFYLISEQWVKSSVKDLVIEVLEYSADIINPYYPVLFNICYK